jgi:DNA repair protein RadC
MTKEQKFYNSPSEKNKTIKDLSEDQRPREKLLKCGADKLNDAELLAILLRTGTKGKSVIEIAEEILKSTGGTFKGLAGKDTEEIAKILGVKDAKIATVAAALEISRRISKQILKDKGII